MEAVIALQPDLVLVAEGMINSEQLKALDQFGIPVYVQKGNSLQAILESTHRLNQLFENRKAVNTWIEQQQHLLKKYAMHKSKASYLAIISTNPIYGHDSFMSNLMGTLGLDNALDTTITATYPMLNLEYVLRVNPTYFILPSNFESSQALFVDYPLLKKTKAYQDKHVIYVDENLFSRPSPKAFELLPLLHQQVYDQK
jgi:iron complex transport system substrate-binding protein